LIEMLNCDCMDYMATLPDKAFELAIVDPPYGDPLRDKWKGDKRGRFGGNFNAVNRLRGKGGRFKVYDDIKDINDWDNAPPPEYFIELNRVARKAIIWGGNNFVLSPCKCFIVWDKTNIKESFSMSMCEYAWTNIDDNAKIFAFPPQSNGNARIHPTQKPVALYKWLLSRYANPGDRILDTHGGSGSICIACHDLGYDLTWMELDADYYAMACERYKRHAAQGQLFEPKAMHATQGGLF
jgi:site-specific DNA-methyltransferase (adenine-specific)